MASSSLHSLSLQISSKLTQGESMSRNLFTLFRTYQSTRHSRNIHKYLLCCRGESEHWDSDHRSLRFKLRPACRYDVALIHSGLLMSYLPLRDDNSEPFSLIEPVG